MQVERIQAILAALERTRSVNSRFKYQMPGTRKGAKPIEFFACNAWDAAACYFGEHPTSRADIDAFMVEDRPISRVPPHEGGCKITAREHNQMQKRAQRIRLAVEGDHLIPRNEADKLGIPLDHPNVAPLGSRWMVDGPNRTLTAPDGRTGAPVPVGGRPKAPQNEVLEAARRFVVPAQPVPAVPDAYPASEDNMAPDAEDYDASDPRAWPPTK